MTKDQIIASKQRTIKILLSANEHFSTRVAELETERDLHRWGLQWMLNNLTGIEDEWAKEACNIARQSLNR
jgi:hypothetical protein